MKAMYLILLLLLIPGAAAETGIVLNSSDYVLYKFDTATLPTLSEGEYIIYTTDINEVKQGAYYNGAVFVNPVVTPVAYEETIVETTGLDPTTQAAISAVTGAASAYLVVRKKKTV